MIFLKKAISILLLMTTLLGCCSLFFSCDDDPTGVSGVTSITNSNAVIYDMAANMSSLGLSAGETHDTVTTAKWDLKAGRANAANRILNIEFASNTLTNYKEITFWAYNDSATKEDVVFNLYFVMSDGTEYRAQTDLDNPYVERLITSGFGNTVDMTTVNSISIHPGWHKYTVALDEVEPLSGQSRVEYTYNEKTGKSTVKFDKSAIVGIKLDASNATFDNNLSLHIGSIEANTNKYGTMKGFGISKASNAVCFYKESNFCLYNQLRYCLVDDEDASLGTVNDSVYVPIAMLAEHRGATITVNTKEEVSFNYNGSNYTFKAGDTFTYVSNERTSIAGQEVEGTTSSIGNYLTIPMEVAASALGYQLFYDITGLAIFSDRPNPDENTDWENDWENVTYVAQTDDNYYEDPDDGVPGRQLGYISQIVKVICFDYYTGADLLDDMDTLYGENVHGNLVITNAQIEKLKEYVETDSVYKAWFTALEESYAVGTTSYTAKLPYFHLPDNQRLNHSPSETIVTYAFLYRMTGNEDYAKRVVKLMEALAKFVDPVSQAKSWHPEHYLDCGLPSYYFSIGYDWCYDYIAKDSATLKKLENAAWEYGFGAAMGHGELFDWWKDPQNIQDYNNKAKENNTSTAPWGSCRFPYCAQDDGQYNARSYDTAQFLGNWNAVCNNGIISLAFAFSHVDEKFRAASEYILTFAINDTTYAMTDTYGPDGGHPEGPGYWLYGTQYQMPMFFTIKNCTGSYHGLNDLYGFKASYEYVLGLGSGSSNLAWNYHDCADGTTVPTLQFISAAYMLDSPGLAQYRYNQLISNEVDVGIWDLMFYDPTVCYENSNLDLSLDYISYKIGFVTFKSDWTDSQMFCGLHGGANNAGHGQLDIGTFILEYNGTRFFTDLGSDNYSAPGYFAYPARHWLYTARAEGHNTLIINPTKVNKACTSWGADGQYVNVWKCDYWQRTNATNSNRGMNQDQAYSAISNIIDYATTDSTAYGVIDMSSAYGFYDTTKEALNGQSALNMTNPSGKRGILVTDNRTTVIIQDEMDLSVFKQESNTIIWNAHIIKGGTITVSDDGQSALITYNGSSLLCEIVLPDGYEGEWHFESRSADYLRETGLSLQPGEYSRDGKQKLVAVGTVGNDLKIAVVCRLLSAGPHSYNWTDIDNWSSLL